MKLADWLFRLLMLGMVGFICWQLWKIKGEAVMISYILDRLR